MQVLQVRQVNHGHASKSIDAIQIIPYTNRIHSGIIPLNIKRELLILFVIDTCLMRHGLRIDPIQGYILFGFGKGLDIERMRIQMSVIIPNLIIGKDRR